MSRVVLFGASGHTAMYHHYLTHDSPHEVVGFTVDATWHRADQFAGLPLVPFENLELWFPPDAVQLALPIGFHQVNGVRAARFAEARARGYRCITYVHPRATVASDVVLGENTFVLEGAVVKPGAVVGDDVIVEANAVVGHHVVLGDHAFVGPACSILGHARLGPSALLGAHVVVREHAHVGAACLVGVGAYVNRDLPDRTVLLAPTAEPMPGDSLELADWLLADRPAAAPTG